MQLGDRPAKGGDAAANADPAAAAGYFARRVSEDRSEDGHGEQLVRQCPSTCDALRTAVASLYYLDDFDLKAIGEGFFSKVYKVRHFPPQKNITRRR